MTQVRETQINDYLNWRWNWAGQQQRPDQSLNTIQDNKKSKLWSAIMRGNMSTDEYLDITDHLMYGYNYKTTKNVFSDDGIYRTQYSGHKWGQIMPTRCYFCSVVWC